MKKTIQKKCKCPCHELGTHNCMICDCRRPVSQKEPEEWWDEFIFTFVSLKEKQQGEHGGEYVSPYTAGNIKKFIKKLLSQQRTQTIEEENKRRALEAVTYGHLVDSGSVTLKEMAQKVREETIEEIKKEVITIHKELNDQLKGTFPDRYSTDYKHGILRGYTLVGRFIYSLK